MDAKKLASVVLLLGAFLLVASMGYRKMREIYNFQIAEAKSEASRKVLEELGKPSKALRQDLSEEEETELSAQKLQRKIQKAVPPQAAERAETASEENPEPVKKVAKPKKITVEDARDTLENFRDMNDSVEGIVGF